VSAPENSMLMRPDLANPSSAISLSTRSGEAYAQEMKCQTGILSGMADSVAIISKSFEELKATCTKSGSLNEQAFAAIESTKQMLMYASLRKC
jgi:hypothetical protein